MKICIAQQNYHIGNFESNLEKIISAIEMAKSKNADLIVFSELAICGYPPRDFLEFDEFLQKCNQSIDKLCPLSKDIGILIGAPAKNPIPEGKNLFNAAYFLHKGEIKKIIQKALLPTYDVFDEYRYFEPGFEFCCIDFNDQKIAVTICEDIWDLEDDPVYRVRPMDILIKENPCMMINLSASPFSYIHAEKRKNTILKNVKKYSIPMVYCNTVGSQTEIIFDGGSIVANQKGEIISELPYFQEHLEFVEYVNNQFISINENTNKTLPSSLLNFEHLDASFNISFIYDALVMGIRQYFEKMGFTKAVIASSGGIDSAVTLALACQALGSENVIALLMPSQFSTNHSIEDAVLLSKNLNNPYHIIPIKDVYHSFESTLSELFEGKEFDVTEENIQSRIRGVISMAMANKFNYILLNTSNKSELSNGYGTLYGDMAGGISVLGDVYKTQVFELAKYINRIEEIIPQNILTKPPSAELRPDQKDSDSLPEYSILDAILFQYIELKQGFNDIVELGYEKELVNRILKMINKNEYKRNQFCPILRVSPKAFGIGRRMPIVAKYEL